MPTINKQTTRPANHAPPAAARGILGRARAVSDLPQAPLKLLLYGGNRVGKTTLAAELAKYLKRRAILVSFEPAASGGAESVRGYSGLKFLKEGSEANVNDGTADFTGAVGAVELARELPASAYDLIILDGATSMQDMILRELMCVDEMPVQMSWGTVQGDQYRLRSEKLREVLWAYLRLPMDIVVLAKEKDHNPPKDEKVNEKTGKVSPDMRAKFLRGMQAESYVAAELGSATTGWLQDCCDWIVRMYVDKEIEAVTSNMGGKEFTSYRETGKFARCLRLGYHPNFAAGPRSSNPGGVPDFVTAATPELLVKELMKVVRPLQK